jgi:hypothetical protein
MRYKIALQNNYEIKIAQNDLKIDESNVAPGNAGMLPSAINCQNNNIQNLSQTRADGTTNSLITLKIDWIMV